MDAKAAEAHLRTLIDQFAPAHLRLVNAARRWLRARLPTAHEVVYEYRDCFVISYTPNGHGYEGVLALRASAKGVSLYFNQGKDLPDPARLLQGAGKQVRSIELDGASMLDRPEVLRLVDEDLARNPGPSATSGRGQLVIRPTAASKR